MSDTHLTVVGIGADGWEGLSERARTAISDATLLIGSKRQLALVPVNSAERRAWPSPIGPLIDALVDGSVGPACILASGDPMLYGIGSALGRRVEPSRLTIYPAVSAVSIACARLGWSAADTELVSLVGHPIETLIRFLQPRRRLVVYTFGEEGASEIVRMLREHGFGPSAITVFEQLGGDGEASYATTAEHFEPRHLIPPYLVAIDCRAGLDVVPLALVPGLPDNAYDHDGQLTKREVRAITLAMLAPLPGELLWDVGAGAGSIAIEWLRAQASTRAVAVEANPERAKRIEKNALALGVPRLEVCCGSAPDVFGELDTPDVVFVGGGLTTPGLLRTCWDRLKPAGRISANAVTLEGERVLLDASKEHGGTVVRIEIGRAEAIGTLTAWRTQFPIVQWSARKESQ